MQLSAAVKSVSATAQIFQISSTMGSIGNLAANLKGGGRYPYASKAQLAYRASKAALNMGKRCMCTVSWQESLRRQYCWSMAAQQIMRCSRSLTSVPRKHYSALLCELSTPSCVKSTYLRGALCTTAETLSLAADLQEDGITVVSVCPGHVTTDMGGKRGEIDAPESIAGQLKVFDSVIPEDTGKFFNFEGNVVPY